MTKLGVEQTFLPHSPFRIGYSIFQLFRPMCQLHAPHAAIRMIRGFCSAVSRHMGKLSIWEALSIGSTVPKPQVST